MVVVLVATAAIWAISRSSRDDSAGTKAGDADIILITIDTLRADSVGFMGNDRVRTPFMDSLAAEGVVFTNAHAHNVVTLPSHANILTGLLPYQHGIRDNAGFTLDGKIPTLATLLRDAGYSTGAFVGAYPLDARFGLDNGFDTYDDRYREGSAPLQFMVAERSADAVLETATLWYRETPGRKFMWVHLFDPHAPYEPPSPFDREFSQDPYLGEISATDAALQRYIGPLIEGKPQTLVVLTSDHGEALGAHGEKTHGLFAYEETLAVPLLVHSPASIHPARDDRPARHVDILPTVLERAGIAPPANVAGRSLFAEIEKPIDTYFEALSASLNRGWAPLVGLIHERAKYIDLPIPELYDLSKDPNETTNIASSDRRRLFRLRQLLEASAPNKTVSNRELSSEEGANLLSLGYISGSAAARDHGPEDDPKRLVHLDQKMHDLVDAYQRGDLDLALRLGREVVAERPDMSVGREMLAFILQQSENPEAAIATLQESVDEGSSSDQVQLRLALMLSENGRATEAIGILEKLSDRNDPDVLNAYGIALADAGRPAEAIRQFERVLSIDATNATAYQNLGVVALRLGDPARAKRYLTEALRLNDQLPLALNTMGVVHAREGNFVAAMDAWQRAVALDPTQYDALYNLAIVAGRSGQHDVARQALERFIRTAPPERYADDLAQARALLPQLGG